MPDSNLIIRLFVIAFGLNVIWEFAHCQLYETCRRQTWAKNIPLLLTMSAKDALLIVSFYLLTAAAWHPANILTHPGAIITFLVLALSFSFIDEKISIKNGRWQYNRAMPTFFGVGMTPFLEIAATGIAAFLLI